MLDKHIIRADPTFNFDPHLDLCRYKASNFEDIVFYLMRCIIYFNGRIELKDSMVS